MKKTFQATLFLALAVLLCCSGIGCKEKGPPEPTVEELLLGTWSRYQNKMYILLMVKANGGWTSDARVEGANSKIIEKKWSATGTWKVENYQLILDTVSSDSDEFWVAGSTQFFQLIEINKDFMTLKHTNGREFLWQRSQVKKRPVAEGERPSFIKFKPMVVNLNKNRSNDKDRYLCLDIDLNLTDLMPDQEIPEVHPQAREAAMLFLSSLVYDDVKSFEKVKDVKVELEKLLNPYLEGKLKDIKINHVVIASSMDKVDEFLIGHAPASDVEEPPAEGSDAEAEKEK